MREISNLGKNIANERRKQKMTQEQLAEFSDLTVNYLSKIERGLAKKISVASLYKITKTLNISTDYLIQQNQEIPTTPNPVGPYQKQLANFLTDQTTDSAEKICKYLLCLIKEIKNF